MAPFRAQRRWRAGDPAEVAPLWGNLGNMGKRGLLPTHNCALLLYFPYGSLKSKFCQLLMVETEHCFKKSDFYPDLDENDETFRNLSGEFCSNCTYDVKELEKTRNLWKLP